MVKKKMRKKSKTTKSETGDDDEEVADDFPWTFTPLAVLRTQSIITNLPVSRTHSSSR